MNNTEMKHVFQEDGESPTFVRRHAQRLNDNFLLRVWIVNPSEQGTLSLQISEADVDEWVDVCDINGDVISFTKSMSTLLEVGSDCKLRWKINGMAAVPSPVNPLDLEEDVRYNLDQYPVGSVKVGIRFR